MVSVCFAWTMKTNVYFEIFHSRFSFTIFVGPCSNREINSPSANPTIMITSAVLVWSRACRYLGTWSGRECADIWVPGLVESVQIFGYLVWSRACRYLGACIHGVPIFVWVPIFAKSLSERKFMGCLDSRDGYYPDSMVFQ